MKKFLRKFLKITLWILASIIMLLILVALSLNIPAVQNFVKNKAVNYLKTKTKTEVRLDRIKIALPKDVVLQGLYVEDLKKDTLLFAEKLQVDISLFKLLKNTVEVNYIELKNIRANVKRINPDTTFNFSFLVDAFMSEETKDPKADTAAPLKFRLDKALFTDIGITYRDDVSGNDMRLYLGEFKARVKEFDMENQIYRLRNLSLKNTAATYLQQKPLTQLVQRISENIAETEKTTGKLPTIEVDNFSFENVKLDYDDQLSATRALAQLRDLGLEQLKIDLSRGNYTANRARLHQSNIQFAFKPAPANPEVSADTANQTAAAFSLLLKKVDLENNTIRFDNLGAKPTKGIDFNHLFVTGLQLNVDDLRYQQNLISAKVNKGAFKEKSGFVLNELKGGLTYTDRLIKLEDFVLRTPNTQLINATELQFTSLNDLTKNPEKVRLNLNFKNTVIGLKDATFFSEAIPAAYRNEKIRLDASMNGYLNNLKINRLHASGLKHTFIEIAGTAKGLPAVDKAYLDLNIRKLRTTKADLVSIIPAKSLPQNLELPGIVDINGKFKGSMTNFNTDLSVHSDLGAARLIANLSGPKNKERYKANVWIRNFNAGKLLKQTDKIGFVTAKVDVVGSGLDPKAIDARFNVLVQQAGYNKYIYRNLQLNGSYANQKVKLKGNMPDSNARFNLDIVADLSKTYPSVSGTIKLERIDLQQLNFSSTPFTFAGNINAAIETADVDYLNGRIAITSLQLAKDGKVIHLDTIGIKAVSTATENKLSLESEFMKANIDGRYQLSKIGQAFINQLNTYYQFGEVVSISDQRLRFAVSLYQPKFLQDFVPQLSSFTTISLSGLIDTQKDSLLIRASLPKIVYGNFTVDSTRLNVSNEAKQLRYNLSVKSVQSLSIALFNSQITGVAANNELDLNIFLRDRQLKDKYRIGGTFASANKSFRFSMKPDQLLLDYEKWTVDAANYIQFGEAGVIAHQFNLRQGSQLLSINSISETPNAPIRAKFENFNIETLTKFADTDTTLAGGTINGLVDIKDFATTPKFEADLKVSKLRYQKDEFGDLTLRVNNNTENAFEVEARLQGVHELTARGFYYTAPQSALDLQVNINRIDLKEIESVSMGQIRQGKGTLSGQLQVKGELTAPKVLGELNFNDAGFNVAAINSYFTMPNQKITFSDAGIRFANFTLVDSLNQKATIDGMVYTSDFRNMRFGLDIRTNNFRAINSTAADNDLIYGTVFLTSNIRIRGDLNQPDINMTVTVNKGTRFFYSLPVNDPSVIDQEGIVQFIDADAPPFNGEKALAADSLSKAPIKGMTLVADITVDPEAELNVVVDPANGDALNVKGDANLNATIDASGKVSLTGRYEIVDGSYNLSVGPLGKKEFKLVKGSTIVWTGEPTAATVDLSAVYEVNAAPIDLINEPENVQAKTKLPFQVYLYMKDELLKPTISFKIDLPENERGALEGAVYVQLQKVNRDENELNKQVFALLALNRFIANNPFQSLAGGGGGVSTLARSSVSKLLTEQLNRLASDLIQGVDLNFDVNSSEDYSTGSLEQKTDLEVGLSKKLLNDRLIVTVGSSFGIEGPKTQGQSSTNIAGNVNVEYALSADGRYRLRAYRRNQNEGVIEGQIIETGLGFTLIVDYNKFKEIFQKRSKRNRNLTDTANERTN